VLIAAALAMTGCESDERSATSATAPSVRVVRIAFAARQHLAEPVSFVITVRNAGDATIDDLVVTLRGLNARSGDGTQRPVWIVDEAPPAITAGEDTRTAGALAPGKQATLRWRLTPVAAGRHVVAWEVAANGRRGARALLSGGEPATGTRAVRVVADPPFARVDPRTGRVVRE
jgi:hypothetical protein